MRVVNIGGPVFLGVVGAILYFAMDDMIPGVDTNVVGLILMAAAVIWLIVGLIVNRPRATVTTERTDVQGTGGAAPDAQSYERRTRQDEV